MRRTRVPRRTSAVRKRRSAIRILPATFRRGRHVGPAVISMNFDDAIAIPIGIGKALPGHCRVPSDVHGMVVFIHGSGSSRHSPRNRAVADYLTSIGLGTLLFDLLTEEEGQRRQNIFDIDLLTDRVTNA